MAYKLKKNKPDFDVVDGPFAGKKYRHNESYEEVPPGEKDRFEVAKADKSAAKPAGKPEGADVKPATQTAGKKKDASEVKKPAGIADAKNPKSGTRE